MGADVETGPNGLHVEDLLRAGQAAPTLPAALDAVGSALLGTPYQLGNAGEGQEDVFDEDPLWRLDVQDCTTYVETVMAAALARDRADFLRTLAEIRYDGGRVSFLTRNHFPEVDWLPNNERAGYVLDVTARLFPSLHRTTTVVIDKPLWFEKKTAESIEPKSRDLAEREKLAETLRGYAPLFHAASATIAYLPMPSFFVRGEHGELLPNRAVLRRIPHAAVFSVVREGWAPGGVAMAISHQGFVIQKPDGTYLRHASEGRAVVEERLDLYFQKFLTSPTLRGINLLEVRDPRHAF
jgi:hypothetical protein